MRLSFLASSAVALIVISSLASSGQTPGYGVLAYTGVDSYFTPLSIGGVPFDPSCEINAGTPESKILPQESFAIAPYFCGGEYEGTDPHSGAFYTETAIGRVNLAWVGEGTTLISISSNGGTAAPAVVSYTRLTTWLYWFDTITVAGPPPGTAVTLRFTNIVNGDYRWDGGGVVTSQSDINAQYYITPAEPDLQPTSCPKGQVSQGFFSFISPNYEPSIDSKQSVEVCAYSGETLTLGTDTHPILLGEEPNWTENIDWSDTVYVDSLTPGVTLITASGANYASPNFKVPTAGSGCNGTFTGTFTGNLEVLPGQNCVFSGGGITGNVTQTGGKLTLTKAFVGGDLRISGGTFSVGPLTTIRGNIGVESASQSQATGGVCGSNIEGYLKLQNNDARIQVGSASPGCTGNFIGGGFVLLNNGGAIGIVENSVGGNIEILNESSLTAIENNQVANDLLVQANTGRTEVFNNIVTHTLQCAANTSITGSGNTAGGKEGQCAKF